MHDQNLFNRMFFSTANEEYSQSITRLIFLAVFYLYYLINVLFFDAQQSKGVGLLLIISFAIFPILHFLWVRNFPQENRYRQFIAVVVDVTTVTTGIYLLEWGGLLFYPIYLWIIVGNGIRFGDKHLFFAMLLAFIEFGYLLFYHPFWHSNLKMGLGLLGIIVLLPLFFLVMLKRLHYTNMLLQEELKHRKQQEAIMIQQSRNAAMGEMIGNIAHQWRQPLNALSLLLQNIIFAYEMGRLDDEIINRAKSKGDLLINTMSTTIDDFRNFFKPNRDSEYFDIALQLDKTLEMLQGSLESNFIVLEKDIAPGLIVDGFPNEFSQVVLNLITNSKDALNEHAPSEKKITIVGSFKENQIILEIRDNGGGVPLSIIDKIFDPYFTTKEEGKGTGIGLYMSKVIVESNMHGQIKVSNDAFGSVFTLFFPKVSGELV